MFEARTNICERKSLETLIDCSRAAGRQTGNEIVSQPAAGLVVINKLQLVHRDMRPDLDRDRRSKSH
jgi:hypothetical protein